VVEKPMKLPEDVAELLPIYRRVLREKRALPILSTMCDSQVAPLRPPEHCPLIVMLRRQITIDGLV
jgi:hypothetical protein